MRSEAAGSPPVRRPSSSSAIWRNSATRRALPASTPRRRRSNAPLRLLGIGPGDEVITSAYTYTASASPIVHVGSTPVLCDVAPGSFEIDYDQVAGLVTEKTRAVIPVDVAGVMCDYDRLRAALESVSGKWRPCTSREELFDRVPIVADGAHSLGAVCHGLHSGQAADLTTFSFHAVKNLTTAEGGALTWRDIPGLDSEELYRDLMLMSLHGQTKDALAKTRVGAWEYDVAFCGWKCNMTDMQAALGLAQLRRYPGSSRSSSRDCRALRARACRPAVFLDQALRGRFRVVGAPHARAH